MTIPVGFQELAAPAEAAPASPQERDPDAPTPEAPYGYTVDKSSGEWRPKKRAGRKPKLAPPELPTGVTPSLEDLKAQNPRQPSEDVAPGALAPPGGKASGSWRRRPKAVVEVPPFRAGPIAKGVNKLYRQAGRIARVMNPQIGAAIIASTRKLEPDDDEDEDDTPTVGEAWEELARINPRIRVFLTKLLVKNAWGNLFRAHLPILLAILMTEGISSRIPFMPMVMSLLASDEDGESSDLSDAMGGVGPQDLAEMMAMAQGLMGQMAAGVPRGMNDIPRHAQTVDYSAPPAPGDAAAGA
jgi:hypothetical protein